jgi:hypothetical protein
MDVLKAIDSAAFVICLDDESPSTAGERYMQSLLQGFNDRPFSNRWLDKSAQFIVTANGLSAALYEHSKLDGLDVRMLHTHITRKLFASPSSIWDTLPVRPSAGYLLRELVWHSITPAVVQRIENLHLRFSSRYALVEQQQVVSPTFNRAFFRDCGVPPNATVHLTVLIAMYLVDGHIRPAWEVALLAGFHRGRPDFTQTVSPAVRAFIEAVGSRASLESKDAASNIKASNTDLSSLFDTAALTHTQAILSAARGRGYVNHLYALLGALTPEEREDPTKVPSLFKTHAWNATRRGGPDQDLKIGFIPDEDEDDAANLSLVPKGIRWDSEGGFLMEGEKGIYVHCAVRKEYTSFSISAPPDYARAAVEGIKNAVRIVKEILELRRK